MIILDVSGSDQTWKFIPRSYTMDSYDLISEEGTTNYVSSATRVDHNGNSDSEGLFLSITDTVTLEDNTYYTFVAKNGSTEIYRDMVFCTTQTITNGSYDINSSEFTYNSTNNDFTFID